MKSEIAYGIAILIAITLAVYGIFSPAPGVGGAGLGERVSGPMILDSAITSSKISNGTIEIGDLSSVAIQNVTDTSTTENTTTSSTWANTQFSQSLTLRDTAQLIIFFSAESKINQTLADNTTRVRARVGGYAASPAEVDFSENVTAYSSQSAMFLNSSVAAGTYTVDIQFASSDPAGNVEVALKNGTMVVLAIPT